MTEACNICDTAINTPNRFGYCDEHLAEMANENGVNIDTLLAES